IYATNANRRFASSENIKTDFKPKGPKRKDRKQQDQLKGLIRKERATRLEGSFGKDKEHYHLRKIKARTEANEKLWIFFGIHTSNAIEIGRKMLEQKQIAA
ncbi:MAG: transposase, partial [Bacteroidales bacterium]|nr:transposase [Bacteroidales bacterium]